MLVRLKSFLLTFLLLNLFVTNLNADVVKGVVVDDETGEPLYNASVVGLIFAGGGFTQWNLATDSAGCFSLKS